MTAFVDAVDVLLKGGYFAIEAARPAVLAHGHGSAVVITSSGQEPNQLFVERPPTQQPGQWVMVGAHDVRAKRAGYRVNSKRHNEIELHSSQKPTIAMIVSPLRDICTA